MGSDELKQTNRKFSVKWRLHSLTDVGRHCCVLSFTLFTDVLTSCDQTEMIKNTKKSGSFANKIHACGPLKADCVLCGSHPYPRLISPPLTLKIKPKKKEKNDFLGWPEWAPNQLNLRSKFIMSPWQHRGNKLRCLDRSWYPPTPPPPHAPPFYPNPPSTPWLVPEGGVSSSQVQGKQSRGGGGLWPWRGRISTSTLHWSKMRILHARASVKGGRVGRWTLRFSVI